MARTKTTPAVIGVRRDNIEEWLDASGLEWSYDEAFALADIDRDKSLGNQARTEPLNDELVDQYREALRRGDRFPAVVVSRGGPRARAINIDGNHRTEAARDEGVETVGAYVVHARANNPVVHTLTMQANAHHGLLTTREERIQQGLWLIDTRKYGLERAAGEVNLPTSALRSRYEKVRADRRADEVGLKRADWDTLVASVRVRLLAIGTDEGFKAAARLAIAAQLTTAQVDDMVTALAEHPKSAAKQEQLVRALRKDYADRIAAVAAGETPSGRKAAFTPRRRLHLVLSSLLTLPEDFESTLEPTFGDADERHQAANEAREAAARLDRLATVLES